MNKAALKEIGIRIMAFIFVGVFATAAFYLYYTLVISIYNTERAAQWVATPAKVLEYDLVKSATQSSNLRADKSERVKAKYTYTYNGQEYTGTQVDFTADHADNFAQERRADQMRMLAEGDITVYVNPKNPSEAVVDRSLPAEKSLFTVIFLLFPCGFATMIIIYTVLYPVKLFYKYAPQVTLIFHATPAAWLLINHSDAFGWRGTGALIFISALIPWALYQWARKIGKPFKMH